MQVKETPTSEIIPPTISQVAYNCRATLGKLNPRRWHPQNWSPRYLKDRLASILYYFADSERPWLTAKANILLREFLQPDHKVLEYGSGRSTWFFAAHSASLISYEHNPQWHARVQKKLDERGASHVEYHFRGANDPAYIHDVERYEPASFDVVLIDGWKRPETALNSILYLKPGGLMIVDNINWFIPNESRAPASIRAYERNNPAHVLWEKFDQLTSDWERVWTTNGVFDTLLLHKPRT